MNAPNAIVHPVLLSQYKCLAQGWILLCALRSAPPRSLALALALYPAASNLALPMRLGAAFQLQRSLFPCNPTRPTSPNASGCQPTGAAVTPVHCASPPRSWCSSATLTHPADPSEGRSSRTAVTQVHCASPPLPRAQPPSLTLLIRLSAAPHAQQSQCVIITFIPCACPPFLERGHPHSPSQCL